MGTNKKGLKLSTIPRRDEYILIENEYWRLMLSTHWIVQKIFFIIGKISLDNQPTK
jgi:hypothetical protein